MYNTLIKVRDKLKDSISQIPGLQSIMKEPLSDVENTAVYKSLTTKQSQNFWDYMTAKLLAEQYYCGVAAKNDTEQFLNRKSIKKLEI